MWTSLYCYIHPVLTILCHYYMMVSGKTKILIFNSCSERCNQQQGIDSTSQTKHIARYLQRKISFLNNPRLCKGFFFFLYKHYLVTVLPVTTGKASGRRFPLFLSPSSVRPKFCLVDIHSHSAGFEGGLDNHTLRPGLHCPVPPPHPLGGLFVRAATQTLFAPPLPHHEVLL